MINKTLVIIIIMIILSFMWNKLQLTLFPIVIYGNLCYFTSIIGGMIIGTLGYLAYRDLKD